MVNRLYEALDVARDATPDQIRKAYRKKALKTHPDRLPPGATESDKARAEEQFRKVNNAYEVLNDEENRRLYDRHGEWPPPEPQPAPSERRDQHRPHRYRSSNQQRGASFGDPFANDPFFSDPFRGFTRNNFQFTDPFTLFDSIFGDMRRHFNDPFFDDAFPSRGQEPFDPFGRGSLFGRLIQPPTFPMLPPMESMFPAIADGTGNGQYSSFQSSSRGAFTRDPNGNGQWVSQSKMTRTINGVTESVVKRTDSNGNEHVTYSYPDGRQRYLINGVEQATNGRGHEQPQPLPQPSRMHEQHSLPPPPPYPGPPQPAPINYGREAVQQPAGPYSAGPYNSASIKHDMERERRSREHRHREHEKRSLHNRDNLGRDYDDRDYRTREQRDREKAHADHDGHARKRWWRGEW